MALHGYLTSFLRRSQPLVDYESQRVEQEADFEKKWEAGEINGWEDQTALKADSNGNQEGIWCSACERGISEVADPWVTLTHLLGQKMYSKQTVYDAHLTSKKHVKATQKQATSSEPPKNPNGTGAAPSNNSMPPPSSLPKDRYKSVALYTHLTTALLSTLSAVLVDTKSNVERRFSLTAREREQELLEQSKAPPPPPSTSTKEGEEEEEEERIYNPLKLPLGWDGKPIPYWLYKLHGLGVEYRCEICSDHVYMGRKNFERHFQESRHAFGMRALGLPNTKHFHEITKIEDALTCAFLTLRHNDLSNVAHSSLCIFSGGKIEAGRQKRDLRAGDDGRA
jgi:splicing factor 3A subunit 3